LDDTVTISEQGHPVPTTVYNRRWVDLPSSLIGCSTRPMQVRVPNHGYLEPFTTTRNIREIANRIKETTFGQICQVPGEPVTTATDPPREALISDIDFIVAYALHLLSVVAANNSETNILSYYRQPNPIKWFLDSRDAMPHIINGYYTASSFMHVITIEFKAPSYEQQNKFSALVTTISNCCVGVTDVTYQHRSAKPGRYHSMDVEKIRKILCGRPPLETVWPEVYTTITQGKFVLMNSKTQGGCIMGVFSNSLKYWLPNYNHTKHILLSSADPYLAEELVVVPSERDQIITAKENR
jgi:hypothetical protein